MSNTKSPYSSELTPTHEQEMRDKKYVAISDIHNDILSAEASLRERGIVSKKFDEWHSNVHDTHLVLTGDLINRDAPDHVTLRLFRHLAERAKDGNRVTLVLGNHELSLLTSLAHGREFASINRKDLAFLGTGKMVYKRGPVLFLHAYPTRELLADMVEQYELNNGDVPNDNWHVNERFVRAFELLPYAPSESRQTFEELCTLAESPSPESYEHEEEHSAEIAKLLGRLHVKVVVHGHKKRSSGKQAIETYLPGICMINNDTAISVTKNPEHEHRIGSTLVRTRNDQVDITCVNGENASKPNRVHTIHQHLH